MSKSKIEWTDRVWNPVTGCAKVSQGCKNCYAETMAKRFWKRRKFTEVQCHEDRLSQPHGWWKPSMIFVNSMSDLFHEDVPFEFIRAVFTVMLDAPIHTFQVLTKRPARALEFLEWEKKHYSYSDLPTDNIWIGASVEDQKTADERIPLLLQIPAAVKFVSCEPLLGKVDFEKSLGQTLKWHAGGLKNCISWIICGGESGRNARPMHPDWARSLRDQCHAAGVPFFFKQWGEWCPSDHVNGEVFFEEAKMSREVGYGYTTNTMYKVGKTNAGRLLDGREWNELPASATLSLRAKKKGFRS